MKVRVLHVIDHLGYGGAPFVVKGIVERMPADRVESLVCALRPNPRPLPIRAEVITLQGHKYSPAALWAIANLCRSRQVDIIHAHLQKAFLAGLLATYLCPSRLILHEHGPIFRRGTGGGMYRGLLRLLGARADAIIANSEAAKSALQRTIRATKLPIAVVPNFIDLEQFDPDRHEKDRARESLGLDKGKFVVGLVGRLDPAKGVDLLIEAAAVLQRDGGDSLRFLVVGDGPQREHLERQIHGLGLDRIVVLTGLRENPAQIMRAFDVGVVPSRREAFGIAALEMMRMKVPVIVSPVGGLPELVQDGRTGLILPELSPPAIARAIRRLQEDSGLRDKLGRDAFAHASSFDGRAQVEQILEIYMRLIPSQDGRVCTAHQPAYQGAEAVRYEGVHGDIFNSIEQQRLYSMLREAVRSVQTGAQPVRALDFGCGSGNLTRHLISLGVQTVSADVSDDFLEGIRRKFSTTGLSETFRLNGTDLANVPDAHFDLVATYSVLHHVPDYLAIVRELGRVVKPGGIVCIDHEVTPEYYHRPPAYVEFLKKARPRVDWRRILSLALDVRGYKHILRRLANPRYKREGDIHVWPDDHIEWDKIEQVLLSQGFEIVLKHDYLLYKAIYNLQVYHEYQDRCADERVLIARKKK